MYRALSLFVTIASLSLVSACGGGSSSNGEPVAENPDIVPADDGGEDEPEPEPEPAVGWAQPVLVTTSTDVDGYDLANTKLGNAIAVTYSYSYADSRLDTIRYDSSTSAWGAAESWPLTDGPVADENLQVGLTDSGRAVVYYDYSHKQLMFTEDDGWQPIRFLRPNGSTFFNACCDNNGFTFLESAGSLKPTSIEFEDYDPAVGARSSRSIATPVYDSLFNYKLILLEQLNDDEFYLVDSLTGSIDSGYYTAFRESQFMAGAWSDPQIIYEFSETDTLSSPTSVIFHRSTNGNMILGWSQSKRVTGARNTTLVYSISRVSGVWGSVALVTASPDLGDYKPLHVSIDDSGHSLMTTYDGSSLRSYSASADGDGTWMETNTISGFYQTLTSDSTIGDEAGISLFTHPDGKRYLVGRDRLNRDKGLSIKEYDALSGWSSSTYLKFEDALEQDVDGFKGRMDSVGNIAIVGRQGDKFWVSNTLVE